MTFHIGTRPEKKRGGSRPQSEVTLKDVNDLIDRWKPTWQEARHAASHCVRRGHECCKPLDRSDPVLCREGSEVDE